MNVFSSFLMICTIFLRTIISAEVGEVDITEFQVNPNQLGYRLSVFILPPQYNGSVTELQQKTIRSFIYLSPRPKVFLLGKHPSFQELAFQYKRWSVKLEVMVDQTFNGMPLFSSVFARATAAKTELSLIINSDVAFVNAPELKRQLDSLYQRTKDNSGFLIVSPKLEVHNIPLKLTKTPSAKYRKEHDDAFHIFSMNSGIPLTSDGAGAYLWNNVWTPFAYNGSMPPFPSKQSDFDTWLPHNVLRTTNRIVVDSGMALACFSVRDIRQFYEGSKPESDSRDEQAAGSDETEEELAGRRRRRDPFLVRSLAGRSQEGEAETVAVEATCAERSPMEAVACSDGNTVCFKEVPCKCSVQQETLTERVQTERQKWLCHAVAPKPQVDAIASRVPVSRSTVGLQPLREMVHYAVGDDNVVILVAVSGRYCDMLMSFICNLRRLGLRDPLVAALDAKMYHFARAQGLPVYPEKPPQELGRRIKGLASEKKCKFGSTCFRQMTKLKSRAVLRVLKLGHHVLWSDVDIFWFRDPVPELLAFGPGTFPVQCDAWNTSIPPSGLGFPSLRSHGTINSGFYFARSEQKVIRAFESIVEHAAARLNQSEQPSFYNVLCGEQQEFVTSETECVWENGLRTVFLDRKLHPNGRVFNLWRAGTVGRCVELGCASLHNNWIKGMDNKVQRFKRKGMWHWDEFTRLCRYDWYASAGGLVKATRKAVMLKTNVQDSYS